MVISDCVLLSTPCKAEALCLATLCKVCKATQATPVLVPEAGALWNEGSDSHQHSTLCSGLWAYPNTDWQHWHPNFGSVFWPTLVSKLGFTQVLSQLSQAAPTFADADLLLCSGTKCKPPALREFHMLSCPCLFSWILWWNWWEKKYSHWAALLLFAGISPVVPHPLFMLIQGEIVFSWSKQDLTQEDWKTQTRGKYSSDLKVSYVVGLS